METDQNKSFYTPRRVQKCLFASSENNSRKRNILQDANYNKEIDIISEEESDLGPMSPLAFTDRSPSSSDSSSGREYVSPFVTPEKSLCNKLFSWDRLSSRSSRYNSETRMSPFSSLKKVARSARYSPRCKIFNENSSKSLPSSPEKLAEPLTPQRSKIIDAMMSDIVPETPQRNLKMQNESITETPQKPKSPEYKLLTPLSSMAKIAPLPKLHRRKSLGTLETCENLSPEQKKNALKRKIYDQLMVKPIKLYKTDNISVSRARAALFQEKTNECNKSKNFTLSTKTFYSNHTKTERPFVFGSLNTTDVKKRRSLPTQNNSYKRSLKKERFGRINAGVFHGIKKPKPKEKKNLTVLKKEENVKNNSMISDKSLSQSIKSQLKMNTTIEKIASSEIDENKRFFKTNKTIKSGHVATVTVNSKIRLKVTDGKIVLNQKHLSSDKHKRQLKDSNITLDATDLSVDEPEVEATLQQDKVADLLKILEDDWEDDYDTMETLVNNTVSPLKPVSILNDMITSPTSELSNMTSTMNIEDTVLLDNKDNNHNTENSKEEPEKRYFPLFTKGYSVPDIFEYVFQYLHCKF
jgi:N-acetyltransferase